MKLYAILGEKLSHTLSPQIHTYLFNKLNINANYSIIEAKRESLDKIIDSAKVLGYSGLNVTIPYKELIIPYIDQLSPEALSIGAINTIKFENDKTYGYNTDYFGFKSMLNRAHINLINKNVVVFGAGGAAKALIPCLHDSNVSSILVVSDNTTKLTDLKERYKFINTCALNDSNNFFGDIIINATPVGMHPDINNSIVSEDIIKRFSIAVDIVYNPLETLFLKIASENKLVTVNGLYMLIDQAIKAEEIFHSVSIDLSIGECIFEEICHRF